MRRGGDYGTRSGEMIWDEVDGTDGREGIDTHGRSAVGRTWGLWRSSGLVGI